MKSKLLGGRIKLAREALGMSQEELAEKLDTTPPTVSRWEAGMFPGRIGLPAIAKALHREVDWFQRRDESVLVVIENLKKQLVEQGAAIESLQLLIKQLCYEVMDLKVKQITEASPTQGISRHQYKTAEGILRDYFSLGDGDGQEFNRWHDRARAFMEKQKE